MEMEWQTIDTAPKDEDILVSYLDNGKRQRAIARYQTDMYDGQEGWYEQIKNYTDYQGVRMHHQLPDGMSLPIEIDFWMPLPEFPNSPQASVEPHWQAQPASMPHAAPVDAQDGGDYCERLRRVIHDALTSGKPRYNYLGAVGCTTGKIGLPQHRTINKETTP